MSRPRRIGLMPGAVGALNPRGWSEKESNRKLFTRQRRCRTLPDSGTAASGPNSLRVPPAPQAAGDHRHYSRDQDRCRAAEDHRGNRAQPLGGQSGFHRAPLIGRADE